MPKTCAPQINCGNDKIELTHGWIKVGALTTLLGVVLTVFGTQGISPFLTSRYEGITSQVLGQQIPQASLMMDRFERATLCQLIHGLAMVLTGILISLRPRRMLRIAQGSFLAGTLLYSGTLIANVITGKEWLATTAMLGGVVLVVGWIALVEGACQGCKS